MPASRKLRAQTKRAIPIEIARADHPGPVPRVRARISWRRNLLLAAGVALLTISLYSPVWHYPFIDYDDTGYIVTNTRLQNGLSIQTIKWAATATEQANWHPLTWISHAADYRMFGLWAGGHHITSVALHALNAALLFIILGWITGAFGRSLLVAALFAVHPLNVESVAWIAQRKTVLCMLLFLLTLAAYAWYARRPSVKRYSLMALSGVLALASKPMAITLPCVLLVLDFWPLGRIQGWSVPSDFIGGRQARLRWLALEKIPLFVFSAASAIITVVAQRAGGAIAAAEMYPYRVRLANAIDSYVVYAWKTLWPTRLAVFYPWNPLVMWKVGLAGGVLLAMSWLAWTTRSTRPYLLAGWLWYLGTLVPMIGMVQVGGQARADRYVYLPMSGILMMAVWFLSEAAERAAIDLTMRFGLSATLVAIFALVTFHQLSFWRSDYDLWSHAAKVTSGNLLAEDNLGVLELRAGRPEEALLHFQNASKIDPGDALSQINIGADHQDHGHFEQAIASYMTAIADTSDPKLRAIAYQNLGVIYHRLGDAEKAMDNFLHVLQINPQETRAWAAVGALREESIEKAHVRSPSLESKHSTSEPNHHARE